MDVPGGPLCTPYSCYRAPCMQALIRITPIQVHVDVHVHVLVYTV